MELFSGSQNILHKELPLDQRLDAEVHTLSFTTNSATKLPVTHGTLFSTYSSKTTLYFGNRPTQQQQNTKQHAHCRLNTPFLICDW